jgi:hypothetical protein
VDPAVHSPLRFVAPIALLAAVVIVALVVATSVGGDGEAGSEPAAPAVEQRSDRGGGEGDEGAGSAGYVVQSGDTLDSIAEDTGVSVAQLLELNPGIDPEALSTGQKLKLRE